MSDEPPGGPAAAMSVTVELFDHLRHDVQVFSCGKPSLDSYIQGMVGRDMDERTAVAYALVDRADPGPERRVIGYFTLSGHGFWKRQARRRDRDRHLGAYDPVPAILIGRLALDEAYHGQGLGKELLVAALNTAVEVSSHLGAAVVVVHALDDEAASFYEQLGFTRFRETPNQLYFPLDSFVLGLRAEE